MFANKLPINIEDLLHQRRVESERIEYKESWNPEAVLHSICAFANDFHNLGSGYIIIGVREQNGQPEMPPAGLSAAQLNKIQKELLNLGNSAIRPNYHPLTEQYEIRWCPKMYAASNKSVVDIEKSDGKCLNVIEHLLGKTAGFTHRTAYPLA